MDNKLLPQDIEVLNKFSRENSTPKWKCFCESSNFGKLEMERVVVLARQETEKVWKKDRDKWLNEAADLKTYIMLLKDEHKEKIEMARQTEQKRCQKEIEETINERIEILNKQFPDTRPFKTQAREQLEAMRDVGLWELENLKKRLQASQKATKGEEQK